MSDDSQLRKFLAVGTAPGVAGAPAGERVRRAEFDLTSGTVEVPEDAPEGDALDFLEAAGQDPSEWEVTGFRRIEYGNPEAPFISTRFTYKRRQGADGERVDINDLLATIDAHVPARTEPAATYSLDALAVLIGDMQFGQGIEDPFEAIANTLEAIDRTADMAQDLGGADQILVAWLGDHVEGFVSQGGANVWRTKLTLSEQIRATRRVMYYAVERLAPWTNELIMAAVPGNHGEAQRIGGKGVTRYDDNHDVEALNAVAEAISLSSNPDFEHVHFLVPERDEISLAVEVGGITWGLVHGDKYRPGKHFEWWEQQAFHGGPVAGADILCGGHYHYLLVQEQGRKLFIQVPTLGTDGMWWSHQHGARPHPGIVVVPVVGGEVNAIVPIRTEVTR